MTDRQNEMLKRIYKKLDYKLTTDIFQPNDIRNLFFDMGDEDGVNSDLVYLKQKGYIAFEDNTTHAIQFYTKLQGTLEGLEYITTEYQKNQRFRVLKTIAVLVQHTVGTIKTDSNSLEDKLSDISPMEISSVISYLIGKKYITAIDCTSDGNKWNVYISICLTSNGLEYIESQGENTKQPTLQALSIGNITNSQVVFSPTDSPITGNNAQITGNENTISFNNTQEWYSLEEKEQLIKFFQKIKEKSQDNPTVSTLAEAALAEVNGKADKNSLRKIWSIIVSIGGQISTSVATAGVLHLLGF